MLDRKRISEPSFGWRVAGASRRAGRVVGLLVCCAVALSGPGAAAATDVTAHAAATSPAPPYAKEANASPSRAIRRVVSLNPSLTAITLALGAGDRLVGVDDYSARIEEEVAALPRVGGLFSPNLEAVLALEPDVVVLVPSVAQRDFRKRLEGLGVRVEVFENIRFDDVLENIERLGRMLGRPQAASARIEAIAAARARAREAGDRHDHPSAVIVIQREPLYVVGRGSFMAEMLAMLGAENLGDAFDEAYPRAADEWLVASAPEVLIDMVGGGESARAYWSRHESLPAVRGDRVRAIAPGAVSLPGPDLDRSLAVLAGALYGAAAQLAVAGEAAIDAPPQAPGPRDAAP